MDGTGLPGQGVLDGIVLGERRARGGMRDWSIRVDRLGDRIVLRMRHRI